MSKRNTLPDQPDLLETKLDTQLQNWRASAPPAHLKSRIAEAVQATASPQRFPLQLRWRHALAVGACLILACALLLNRDFRPQPVFAEVEEAMQSVKTLSYRIQNNRTLRDGSIQHVTNDTWIRRTPPAIADHTIVHTEPNKSNPEGKEVRLWRISDAKQRIRLDELTGVRKVSVKPRSEDVAKEIELCFYALTHPGNDHPSTTALLEKHNTKIISPWQAKNDVLDGKPVWKFTLITRTEGYKDAWGEKEMTSTTHVWADAKTHRVVRKESFHDFGNGKEPVRLVTTNFRYNEPLPAGIFDPKPPKKK